MSYVCLIISLIFDHWVQITVFATIAIVILSAGFVVAEKDERILSLEERIAALEELVRTDENRLDSGVGLIG